MKTTLPNLPYQPTGFYWSNENHSSAYTKRRYPQTDLAHLDPWVTFATDTHDAITTRMATMKIASGAVYDIGSMPKKRSIVENEKGLRMEAGVQLHDLVEEALEILGIGGRFALSGTNQIVGNPDFFWLHKHTKRSKLVVRVPLLSVFDWLSSLRPGRVQNKMGCTS
jgi:hypothetical protein